MDSITDFDGMQVLVSGDGEITSLEDRRFNWRERKEKTMGLFELYEKAGYPDYAERTRNCATYLQFNVYQSGERRLKTANFCKLRLCPMCIGRRARRNAWKLSQVLDLVEKEHKAKVIFLTLTMRNVDGEHLGEAISQITKGWYRLMDQRPIARSLPGWFRAIEITRGNGITKGDKGYHVHIHGIGAVEPDYFSRESRRSGKYLNQEELIQRWKKALRVDYDPSVQIATTKARRKRGGVESASLAAAKEGAKYPVKDEEYIDPALPEDRAIEILRDYTEALRRRRLMAFGGWMKEAAKKLDAENLEDDKDLVHVDEDSIRDDLIVMVEGYGWHLGAGDFILTNRQINPLEC